MIIEPVSGYDATILNDGLSVEVANKLHFDLIPSYTTGGWEVVGEEKNFKKWAEVVGLEYRTI